MKELLEELICIAVNERTYRLEDSGCGGDEIQESVDELKGKMQAHIALTETFKGQKNLIHRIKTAMSLLPQYESGHIDDNMRCDIQYARDMLEKAIADYVSFV